MHEYIITSEILNENAMDFGNDYAFIGKIRYQN